MTFIESWERSVAAAAAGLHDEHVYEWFVRRLDQIQARFDDGLDDDIPF